MKVLFATLAAVVWAPCALCLAARPALAAGLAATGKVCTQDGMSCRYWEPVGYDAAQKYPLVLYLHGAGQSGTDNTSQIDDWGSMPGLFLADATRARFPAFFVAPQALAPEGDTRWVNWDWSRGSYDLDAVPESTSMKKALAIVQSLRSRYNVDSARIYVAGESMGGFGAWDAISRHPDLFAAAVPTDGGGSPKAAARLRDRTVFAAHYARDGSVPSSSDREMFLALAKAGGRATYVEIDLDKHGIAGKVLGEPGFFDWLYAQRLGVAPSSGPPQLALAPWGGVFAGAVSVTVKTMLDGASLRYATDGTLPITASSAVAGAVSVGSSAILIAAAFVPNDDGHLVAYQSAPFMIGGQPLPGGAVLGSGNGGAQGAGGAAGNPAAAGSGAAGRGSGGVTGSAGAAGSSPGEGDAGGSGGSAPSTGAPSTAGGPGSGGSGAPSASPNGGAAGAAAETSRVSAGCHYDPQPRRRRSFACWWVVALALGSRGRRRRTRSG